MGIMHQTDHQVDLNAKYYRKHSQLQQGLADQLLKSYYFERDAKVLDVGCGDGRITAHIASEVPEGKVIGVDSSNSMIELGTASFPKTEFPNLEFKLGKAEELSFSESFDNIVSFSCFHWVREPHKALIGLTNMLRPGGELLILAYPKESLYYEFLQEALKEYPEYSDISAYRSMLPIKEYKKILKNSDMEILEFTSKNLIHSYKNKEDVKDFIRGWLTSFVPLPEHLHEAYLNLAVEKSLKYHIDMHNDMINLPYTALVIIAKKHS